MFELRASISGASEESFYWAGEADLTAARETPQLLRPLSADGMSDT
jgi:hypothetical protein